MKSKICANCGHEKGIHRLKVFRTNRENQIVSLNTRSGIGCMVSGCPCRKFTPENHSPHFSKLSEVRTKGETRFLLNSSEGNSKSLSEKKVGMYEHIEYDDWRYRVVFRTKDVKNFIKELKEEIKIIGKKDGVFLTPTQTQEFFDKRAGKNLI